MPTLVLYFFISVSFPPGDPFLERIEEEPRAVFLHLFRGVVFLSFSAFSGRWFELFTVTFRRVQRFYAIGDYGRNRNKLLWVQNPH